MCICEYVKVLFSTLLYNVSNHFTDIYRTKLNCLAYKALKVTLLSLNVSCHTY